MKKPESLKALSYYFFKRYLETDEQLGNICIENIQNFINADNFQDARLYVYDFYAGFEDSLSKENILTQIQSLEEKAFANKTIIQK